MSDGDLIIDQMCQNMLQYYDFIKNKYKKMLKLNRDHLMIMLGLSGILFLTGCYQVAEQPTQPAYYPVNQGYYGQMNPYQPNQTGTKVAPNTTGNSATGQKAPTTVPNQTNKSTGAIGGAYPTTGYYPQNTGYNWWSNPWGWMTGNNQNYTTDQYATDYYNNYAQNYGGYYDDGSGNMGYYDDGSGSYDKSGYGSGGAYDYYGGGGSYGDQTYQDIYDSRAATNQEINDNTSQWLYDDTANYINPETGELETLDTSGGSDWYQTSDGDQWQTDDTSYTPEYATETQMEEYSGWASDYSASDYGYDSGSYDSGSYDYE
jgi:hypothetical protein